jgi:transcriptional regulator of acetoin/glycerol metabolism
MDAGVSKLLETLLLNLRDPISTWLPSNPLVLPPAAATGTVILHEVGTLGYEDQLRLLYWLERAQGRIQVVSTNTAPLLPSVQSGAFIDTLYYRLNTICVDVETPRTF